MKQALLSKAHLIYDAHTHLHLDQSEGGREGARTTLTHLKGAALMSTTPSDWATCAELAAQHPNVRPLFGLHPWFAHRYTHNSTWLEELRTHLTSTVGSAVGEIGLDRKWRTPDTGRVELEAQRVAFYAQLNLAAELELPVSLHCVHAQGELYQALSEAPRLPPTLYLHAFGGSAGTVEQLTRSRRFGERLYFGFAACVNLRSPKTRATIMAVPEDRLVVESDRSSAAQQGQVEAELLSTLSLYAELKGWSGVEEAAERTALNAARLYAAADVSIN